MMSKVKIYMDDLRPCPDGWLLTRDAHEMIELMLTHEGNIIAISLDHDLGESEDETEYNGYWFVKKLIDLALYTDTVYLHTANPAGRENMFKYLECAIREDAVKPMKLHRSPCWNEQEECGGNGTDF